MSDAATACSVLAMLDGTWYAIVHSLLSNQNLHAAVVAVAGVAYTAREANRRHKSQLENDRTKNKAEREHAMRREVYIEAAAAAARTVNFLATVYQRDLTEPNALAPLVRFYCSSNRIQVVGSVDTVNAVANVNKLIQSLIFSVTDSSIRLTYKKIRLEQLQKKIGATKASSDELKTFLDRARVKQDSSDDRDTRTDSVIYLEQLDEVVELSETAAKLSGEIARETTRLAPIVAAQLREISLCLVDANVAIRKELNVASDESYEEQVKKVVKDQYDEAFDLMDRVKADLDQRLKGADM